MNNLLLKAALNYRKRGWSCIPMLDNKKPKVKWKKYAKRLPTKSELLEWFSDPHVVGVALIAGEVSGGLAILDFDKKSAYKKWKRQNPELAAILPTVRTKRGYHVYCWSDLAKTVHFGKGNGEYRGAEITIAPPSLHPTGIYYEWIKPLPNGPLPFVSHKLLIPVGTERNRESEYREDTEKTESNGSVVSVPTINLKKPTRPDFSVLSVTLGMSKEELIKKVIKWTLPKQSGERNDCIFNLARGLKFNCGLAGESNERLRRILKRWHRKALSTIGTKSFDESWSDFLHAWKSAKHPLGLSVVQEAASRVDLDHLPKCTNQYDTEPTRHLIGLCAEMASINDRNGWFFLSCRDAGKFLHISHKKAAHLLAMLCDDEVLKLLEKGNAYSASRYRFISKKCKEGK